MIRPGQITIVAAITLALATGCSPAQSPPQPPTPPPTMTHRDLCDSLMTFFSNELHAIDLIPQPLLTNETPARPVGDCTVVNAQSRRLNGNIVVLNAPNDLDPTDGVVGFTKTIELNPRVLLKDTRVDKANPGDYVILATRFGDWNGNLKITDAQTRTANGTLQLTDDDIHRAARYLVELTRKLPKT